MIQSIASVPVPWADARVWSTAAVCAVSVFGLLRSIHGGSLSKRISIPLCAIAGLLLLTSAAVQFDWIPSFTAVKQPRLPLTQQLAARLLNTEVEPVHEEKPGALQIRDLQTNGRYWRHCTWTTFTEYKTAGSADPAPCVRLDILRRPTEFMAAREFNESMRIDRAMGFRVQPLPGLGQAAILAKDPECFPGLNILDGPNIIWIYVGKTGTGDWVNQQAEIELGKIALSELAK